MNAHFMQKSSFLHASLDRIYVVNIVKDFLFKKKSFIDFGTEKKNTEPKFVSDVI